MAQNDLFKVNNIYRHIYVIENVITDSECEYFIKYIDNNTDNINNKSDDGIVTALIKSLYDNNENDIIINNKIYKICNKIFRSIMNINPFIEINGDIHYHLRKIYGPTNLHTDEIRATMNNYFDNKIRTLSVIINLNDNYEGGVFHFPKQKIKHKLKKGSAILFPPFWTHPHEVSNPSTYRYTITTWGTEKIIK